MNSTQRIIVIFLEVNISVVLILYQQHDICSKLGDLWQKKKMSE